MGLAALPLVFLTPAQERLCYWDLMLVVHHSCALRFFESAAVSAILCSVSALHACCDKPGAFRSLPAGPVFVHFLSQTLA